MVFHFTSNSLIRTEKKYLPEFVYGSIDGVVTTFAVVSGSLGAGLSPAIILLLGFANLFADGFSMAAANYLSAESEVELKSKSRIKRNNISPIKSGIATFFSFFIAGFIPLISYVLASFNESLIEHQFVISLILTGAVLFIIGLFKGELIKKHPLRSALETLIIGGIASVLAFLVGYVLKNVIL